MNSMPPRLASLSASFLLLVAASAAAQAEVIPRSLANVEGSSSSSIPFGLPVPSRLMCLFDRRTLSFGPCRQFTGIRLRPDHDPSSAVVAKAFVDISVRLSTTAAGVETASDEFDRNHGTDVAFVIQNRRFALPGSPMTASGPHPFVADFPFDRPWTFGLSPVFSGERPANLCIDIQTLRQSVGDWRLDIPVDCTSASTLFGSAGPFCLTTAGTGVSITASSNVTAGGDIVYTVSGMPASIPFAVNLSLLRQDPPISLSGASLPSPDCFINVLPFVTRAGLSGASGTGAVRFPVARNLDLVGQSLFSQAVVADGQANPLGIVTSLGIETGVCGPLAVARIFEIGDAGAVMGQVSFGTSFVAELR